MNRATATLCSLHLLGNALLLWLGYYWLGIGESDAVHLLWSALLLAVLFGSALWLHGTGLRFFSPDMDRSILSAARGTLRNLVPLFVLCMVAILIYSVLAYWHNSFGHWAFVIGSYATLKLRKPIAPSGVLRTYFVFIWLLRWLVVPALVLPIAAKVAVSGWAGFRPHVWGRGRQLLYWIEVCVLLVCAVSVPLRLIQWVPEMSKFSLQMVSFLLRLGCGYLLFVAALLVLEFVTSTGRPRLSQPRTVSSP